MLQCEDYFMVRTPMCSYDTINFISDSELKKIFGKPSMQEALFLASPELYDRLGPFINEKLTTNESDRISLSLKKYLFRMSCRPTPFGTFACVSIGIWDKKTNTMLSSAVHRHTRLDTEIVSSLVQNLLLLPTVSERIRYFANNTAYMVNKKIRYIEYRLVENKRKYQLSDFEEDEILMIVLREAAGGKTKSELAESIVCDGIKKAAATAIVEEMLENQLLISELEIRLTGKDYFVHVLHTLEKHGVDMPILKQVARQLKDLEHLHSKKNLLTYSELSKNLKGIADLTTLKHFVQTDSHRDSVITINEKVCSTVVRTIKLLAALVPPRKNELWENFRKEFFERFSFEQVPLCHALDPEIGIGYPAIEGTPLTECTLLQDIAFPEPSRSERVILSPFQLFLINEYSQALQFDRHVQLEEDDLKTFFNESKLPSSLYAMISVFADSEKAIDEGKLCLQFHGAYGPSAISVMARFSYLEDDLSKRIARTLRKEEESSRSVFAEIVHADQAKTGNICTRPILRSYEIPILTQSGVDEEHTLPIHDLMLSCAGDRLVLYSKKLGREVIPRLSSAHNYNHDTIAFYRFLSDMQFQGVTSVIQWDWGVLKSAPFLPRVCISNVILSPAKWKITDSELDLLKKTNSLPAAIAALRARRKMPPWVLIGEGDNKIPVDLDNPDHLEVFRNIVRRSGIVEEFIGYKDMVIKDVNGKAYQHELVVPLTDDQSVTQSNELRLRNEDEVLRQFVLGSEWLYYKIYCKSKTADSVLLEFIKPLTEMLIKEKIIDQWFYVRYNDPKHHIRVRFHGRGDFYRLVIARFHSLVNPFIQAGFIYGLSTDSYQREFERYGHADTVLAERIFFVDSVFIVQLLKEVQDTDDLRWRTALVLAYQLLDAFQIPLEKRTEMMGFLQNSFMNEMGGGKELKHSMSQTLRTHKVTIEILLSGGGLPDSIQEILRERREAITPLAEKLLKKEQSGTLSTDTKTLVQSFIHMTLNRLFRENPRHYEMILYDFLHHHFKSMQVRNKAEAQ